MSTKYVITFSNCTEHGVSTPEKIYNKSVLEFVTSTIANSAKSLDFNLDNCTAYEVNVMYKGVSETSFRLEYITTVPVDYMKGYALWVKDLYRQESILFETYSNRGYKAVLIFSLDEEKEL